MKTKLPVVMSVLVSGLVLFYLTACNTTPKEPVQTPEIKAAAPAPEDTMKLKAYVCPMGPTCGQGDSAGKCPSCGMDMKANPKFKK
jgi:hypothetical protein